MYCWSGVNQRNCYTSFISWPLRFVTKNLFIYNLTPSSAAQVIYNLLTFRPFYILEWFTGFFNPGPRYILYCKAALLQYYRVLISRRGSRICWAYRKYSWICNIFYIMASSLDQLRKLTTVVADTGDFAGENFWYRWVTYMGGGNVEWVLKGVF